VKSIAAAKNNLIKKADRRLGAMSRVGKKDDDLNNYQRRRTMANTLE